ncbi:putative cation efflux protein [Crocosphaera subtropica ATCC 51142]|uniref:Cation efflux protein n=1 Tax=Crocosphaera subtropica (strain ATCC 51142 / BH68) TaxID=43989 RepID=B1WTB1_CROS5|nr:cation transporter [Crocosphaera subtropica]ACB52033.1 putative cation efflux protein [Crocosphaera subtropica ATCC 51142]
MNRDIIEKIGLILSIIVTLFMSILGIGFGIFVESEAILLDGFFNIVSFIMALITLGVAWLQRQPENEYFNFGYLSFVPLVNLIKGLLIFLLSLFALTSAISIILHGGRTLNANIAIIYAFIAAVGCLTTALIQKRIAQKTRSIIIEIDAKNWLINGLISLSVGIAFTIIIFIKNTSLSWFIPYADSVLVIVLVLITLPVPTKIIIDSLKQLLLASPSPKIQREIKQLFETTVNHFPLEKYWLRMTQIGNTIFISIYWLFPQDYVLENIEILDQIREKISKVIYENYTDIIIDVIFTKSPKWAENITHNNNLTNNR